MVNFVHLKTQTSLPQFTWERDYWLDHSLLLWTLLFLHQVASASLQKLFCEVCSALKCSFEEFVREKVVFPSYSSVIFPQKRVLKSSTLAIFQDFLKLLIHVYPWLIHVNAWQNQYGIVKQNKVKIKIKKKKKRQQVLEPVYLQLPRCVTLENLPNSSVPWFSHLQNECNNISYLLGSLCRLNKWKK